MTEPTTVDASTDTGENTRTLEFASPFPGTRGRPKSLYLDIQERVEGEEIRAIAEGREPDLSDPSMLPPTVGTAPVLVAQVPDNEYANPTQRFPELQQEKVPEVVATAEVEEPTDDTSPANDGNAEVVNEEGESSEVNETGNPDDSEDSTADGQTGFEFNEDDTV